MQDNELCDRLFNFSVEVLRFLKTIKNTQENNILKFQLAKSATSCGANYEESQGASSTADFSNKVRISLKEIRETNYWLRIIDKIEIADPGKTKILLNESSEIKKILGAICSKVRRK
ncbi:MAG: four helix bundle protein [Syntrophaceae bacterium]|nr:four helix bundle protein [Syntrophaceae bacterium]